MSVVYLTPLTPVGFSEVTAYFTIWNRNIQMSMTEQGK